MSTGFFKVPTPINEPVKSYSPGSSERKEVLDTYKYYLANESHVDQAISTALDAKESWENMSWENRAAIFLKAAELIAGPYRSKINAATMIAQSKTVHQAEIDAACEFIDFLRFNVQYVTDIYKNQPDSDSDAWNRVEYRPLELSLIHI